MKRNPDQLKKNFDLVVIGGGITGLAAANEAAQRGLNTCLLEKNDFGCATSAATSKLIHGGLRYLENLEFGLVRESLRERRILGCAAGHLVRPLPFLIPVYDDSHPGRRTFQAGLTLYDMLSLDRNWKVPEDKKIPSHVFLSSEEVRKAEPGLKAEGLIGGFLYYDFQSLHPERLNLEFLKSAVNAGCTAFNHFEVNGFVSAAAPVGKRITAVTGKDTITGKNHTVSGKVFINATGPWMDILLGLFEEKKETTLTRSKGIHLLTDKILNDHAVLFRTKAGRHFFILPWMGYSLIGPTDAPFLDHPDSLHPEHAEVKQLMEDVNDALPGRPLKPEMIHHINIGIRPLIFSGKSTYRASRKSEIYDHVDNGYAGIISVAGGKWTTSRQLGEDLIMMALKKPELADMRAPHVDTSTMPLFGSPGFGMSASEYENRALSDHYTRDISAETHRHLIRVYGTDHVEILSLVKKNKSLAKAVSPESGRSDILAEVVYAVEKESAMTLEDIFMRRLVLGTFGYPGDRAVKTVADLAGKLLKWNSARKKSEILAFKNLYPSLKKLIPR